MQPTQHKIAKRLKEMTFRSKHFHWRQRYIFDPQPPFRIKNSENTGNAPRETIENIAQLLSPLQLITLHWGKNIIENICSIKKAVTKK